MKNILIVETCRDNQGCAFQFIEDISLIPDKDMRDCVEAAINGIEIVKKGSGRQYIETGNGLIFSDSFGYYFSNLFEMKSAPYTVEHIIEHIF